MARKPKRNSAQALRTLHLNEARWQAVLDTNRDAIISIDGCGRIRLFNRSAEGTFGYAAREVVGHNVKMLMPEPYRGEHDGYMRRYRDTGVARAIGRIRAVEGRRKNGEVFPDRAVGHRDAGGRRPHLHLHPARRHRTEGRRGSPAPRARLRRAPDRRGAHDRPRPRPGGPRGPFQSLPGGDLRLLHGGGAGSGLVRDLPARARPRARPADLLAGDRRRPGAQ